MGLLVQKMSYILNEFIYKINVFAYKIKFEIQCPMKMLKLYN